MAKPKKLNLSADVQREIDKIRDPFVSLVRTRRGDFAPEFWRVYNIWRGQVSGDNSFVAFVRLFDETVPVDRDGYRNDPTYQTADYLRRLATK